MAKFSGPIGFSISKDSGDGVWVNKIIERSYRGDVIKKSIYNNQSSEKVNDDISIRNQISIIADQYILNMFHSIKYVGWMNTLWKITSIDIDHPKITLTLGGIYNGPISTKTSKRFRNNYEE